MKPTSESRLRRQLTDAFVRDVGVSERIAQMFVDSVVACLRGQRWYVPKDRRSWPLLLIRSALERGVPVKRVMREFDISRQHLHRLFPGGLPRPLPAPQSGEKQVVSQDVAKVATK